MLHRVAGLALAILALLVPASSAVAAPVTVNLRIEGSTQTLFEGPVTSDAASLATPSSLGAHPCNVGENTAPPSTTRAANPTTALAASGVSWDATWSESSFGNDFLISRIGPDASGAAFWAVFVNARLIDVGGCQFANAAGDAVLWAFDGFGKTPLALSGPTTATAGTPVTVTVRNAQTGAPVAGATVAGSTTDAAGNARVTFAQAGAQRVKAEGPGAIRSNALAVSVGAAGQPQPQAQQVAGAAVDRTAPRARIFSPRNGHTYRRARFSPRTIRLRAGDSGSGIRSVKLRLTRRVGDRCFSYSGRRERFIGAKCGGGFFFTISDRGAVDYLLPEKLPRGHYVLDVVAIDRASNRDDVRERGRNRSVFDVR